MFIDDEKVVMSMAEQREKIQDYHDIYRQLREKLKWKLSDRRIIMIIASIYVMNDRPFSLERFLQVSDRIKKESGFFSPLRSYLRFLIAAMLDVHFDNAEEQFQQLLRLYKKMTDGGFSRGSFTYLSAMTLLTGNNQEHVDDRIRKALLIYKGMKKEHYFLTSTSDYPLAVLLAEREEGVEKILLDMEGFYRQLHVKGFRKGNDLQFLSHVLSLDPERDMQELVRRTDTIYGKLKQSGMNIKTMHYSDIGMLALIPGADEEIKRIPQLARDLEAGKHFGQRDVSIKLAIHFIVHEKLKESNLVETGLTAAIETMIQAAQQAAMIASIAAISAASASNNSS